MMVTKMTAQLPSPQRGPDLPEVTLVGATSDDKQTHPAGPSRSTDPIRLKAVGSTWRSAGDNLQIRHMSAKVGLVEELLLDGIRLGGEGHWIRCRKVST